MYPDTRRLLLERTVAAREERLAHFDALDTKAGILFGFAAALVALSVNLPGLAMITAAGFAATSAAFTFAALLLKPVSITAPARMWLEHRDDEPEALERAVIATTMRELPKLDKALADKAWRIGMGQVFLAAALLCNVAAVAYEGWKGMAG